MVDLETKKLQSARDSKRRPARDKIIVSLEDEVELEIEAEDPKSTLEPPQAHTLDSFESHIPDPYFMRVTRSLDEGG